MSAEIPRDKQYQDAVGPKNTHDDLELSRKKEKWK